ncbi:MAG: tRNA (adenosine(37)-N6)-dimethylallyltransferase MiaA [Proteobacteria bacterium]|nr:tRNA (adenosine(37)-N6)-dimethylallyltransferase MiaA [Pseudomonadota bacterium]
MNAPAERQPIVVVTGPTASGKTPLAIRLCQRFRGEVVNADSMQVYRYMDVGTAKPTLAERGETPHHMLDVVTPDVEYNAGRYADDARRVAQAVRARGDVVFLTGGTGLYIRAFLSGIADGGEADPELRRRLEAEDAAAREAGDPGRLHARLAAVDPETAAALHPNDGRRIVRALEIFERTGESASVVRRRHAFGDAPYRVLHLALDPGREVLTERIHHRCQAMIDAGLLQEVRRLRDLGYGPELRPMQAIGYRHIQPVVDGQDTLANALEAMRRDTRRFARRQRTWLRAVPDVTWLDPRQPEGVEELVAGFLEKPA